MCQAEPTHDRWERIRPLGRGRFVWINGVLGWGVVVGILWTVSMAFLQGWDRLPILASVGTVFIPPAGYWYGQLTWIASEQFYTRHQKGARSVSV